MYKGIQIFTQLSNVYDHLTCVMLHAGYRVDPREENGHEAWSQAVQRITSSHVLLALTV